LQRSAGHADLKVGSWDTEKIKRKVGRISLLYYSAATFFRVDEWVSDPR
jgi:hypothetical protein